MVEIAPRLFIATEDEISDLNPFEYSLCSLAQTFHYQIHSWKRGENHKNDPCYLMCSHSNQILSVNWVDGDERLFDYQGKGVETLQKILTWIEYQLDHNRKVLVMCNQGLSRSPTVALVYLAKVLKTLPNSSFTKAKEQFLNDYPEYQPKGIADFVNHHWSEL